MVLLEKFNHAALKALRLSLNRPRHMSTMANEKKHCGIPKAPGGQVCPFINSRVTPIKAKRKTGAHPAKKSGLEARPFKNRAARRMNKYPRKTTIQAGIGPSIGQTPP